MRVIFQKKKKKLTTKYCNKPCCCDDKYFLNEPKRNDSNERNSLKFQSHFSANREKYYIFFSLILYVMYM